MGLLEALLATDIDRAIEVVNLIPESIEYPFRAVNAFSKSCRRGDPRRLVVFGRAADAYKNRPAGAFCDMLAHHWKDLPRPLADFRPCAMF